jgi:hypothetical protein
MRQLRTTKSWRPGISTLMSSCANQLRAAMVARKPDHQGDREVNRKAIAQGMPDRFGEPVVTKLMCFFHLHMGPWVRRSTRHSPLPLLLRDNNGHNSGEVRRENAGPCADERRYK